MALRRPAGRCHGLPHPVAVHSPWGWLWRARVCRPPAPLVPAAVSSGVTAMCCPGVTAGTVQGQWQGGPAADESLTAPGPRRRSPPGCCSGTRGCAGRGCQPGRKDSEGQRWHRVMQQAVLGAPRSLEAALAPEQTPRRPAPRTWPPALGVPQPFAIWGPSPALLCCAQGRWSRLPWEIPPPTMRPAWGREHPLSLRCTLGLCQMLGAWLQGRAVPTLCPGQRPGG